MIIVHWLYLFNAAFLALNLSSASKDYPRSRTRPRLQRFVLGLGLDLENLSSLNNH